MTFRLGGGRSILLSYRGKYRRVFFERLPLSTRFFTLPDSAIADRARYPPYARLVSDMIWRGIALRGGGSDPRDRPVAGAASLNYSAHVHSAEFARERHTRVWGRKNPAEAELGSLTSGRWKSVNSAYRFHNSGATT